MEARKKRLVVKDGWSEGGERIPSIFHSPLTPSVPLAATSEGEMYRTSGRLFFSGPLTNVAQAGLPVLGKVTAQQQQVSPKREQRLCRDDAFQQPEEKKQAPKLG